MPQRHKKDKRPANRPSEYDKPGGDEKAPAIAQQLTLLGATEEEIAAAFGVSRRSITNWKGRYPQFKQALPCQRWHAGQPSKNA